MDSDFYACICEGAAEEEIMNILLDANKLKFSREQLLEEKIIRCRMARNFQNRYLGKGFKKSLTILRILDSPNEKFKLDKAYKDKVNVIDVITSPEIEMLIIINEDKYTDFQKYKSKLKPSEYCIEKLGLQNVKNKKFIREYFSDVELLVKAIKKHKSLHKQIKDKKCLADLLNE
ncbi:hypothetical protein SAMN05216520_10598 [Kandleria vitulina]|uniref:hypothetical protein n=1 Tax=Kandleria vitulina TaxID=1630 RepID=UPI0008877CF3|nr:hypothetical protein [Kandleria vitulina]SDL42642.1 hypothetical protein SAMN05216520_10598 [Kandleria vitulina]SEI98326.1 hypothetical protein SAMN05216514_10760 [Kandleria vitulina]